MELCRFFNVTPKQIGKLRRDDPLGIAFIEKRIIWEAQEVKKQHDEYERERKSSRSKSRGRIGR